MQFGQTRLGIVTNWAGFMRHFANGNLPQCNFWNKHHHLCHEAIVDRNKQSKRMLII